VRVNFSVARYSYAQLQWAGTRSGAHVYSLDFNQGAWAPTAAELRPAWKLAFITGISPNACDREDDFRSVTQIGFAGADGAWVARARCGRGHYTALSPRDRTEGLPIRPRLALLAKNEIDGAISASPAGSQDSFGARRGGWGEEDRASIARRV
jgi:hypothetical protein